MTTQPKVLTKPSLTPQQAYNISIMPKSNDNLSAGVKTRSAALNQNAVENEQSGNLNTSQIATQPPPEVSDDESDSTYSASTNENRTEIEIPLNFLSHMITPFNGETKELSNFLQNANNAMGLASASQKLPLEMFVFSKISSEVKTKINMGNIRTFTELRDKLKAVYSPVESYDFLMEQLETTKQKATESIKDYFVRLDKITSKCLMVTEKVASSHTVESEKRVIERITLRRFTHHTIPEISQILRHKEFANLNEAFSLACEEEAYLLNEGRLKRQQSDRSSHQIEKYCRNCRTKTHNTKDCRRTQNNHNENNFNHYRNRPYNPGSYGQNNSGRYGTNEKVCNYCSYRGHIESECKRKKYNTNLNPNPRIAQATTSETNVTNHLNGNQSLMNPVPSVDTVNQVTEDVSYFSLE